MAAVRPPRRLPKVARQEQLVAAAVPVLAEQGFADFSFEEIAERADVTRNLLYHYFPRGREDIVLAVVERSGRELTQDWVIDGRLSERLTANFNRMLDHALAPSDAWRIHRRARAADQPEIDAIITSYTERVISSVSLNHLGTPQPPPLVHLALTGFVAFAEASLDEARTTGAPRDKVTELLSETLVATIRVANACEG